MPSAAGAKSGCTSVSIGAGRHNPRTWYTRTPMTVADLEAAVRSATAPPATSPPLVRALWHDAMGDWEAADGVAQDVESADGAWVHAYLHRKEGDIGNAGYWYRRAGKPPATGPLEDEWRAIASALLR